MKLTDKTAALKWLYQDELLNLMSIDLLERDLVRILYAGEDSLLLGNEFDYQIHCLDPSQWPELLRQLLQVMARDHFLILRAHQDWYLDDLKEATGFTDVEAFFNTIYPGDFPVAAPLPPGIAIRPLTMADFPVVRATYRTVDDDDYIAGRIAEGMLGAWCDGELAGFIGTHQEGTVGLLEVLPRFRRRGIARALEAEMLKRLRAQGRRAYGNIAVANELSRTVHSRLGIRFAPDPVYWLFPPEA